MNFTERAITGITANFLMKEAMARYEFAAKYTKKNKILLDMASGSGYGTDYLSKKTANAIGIDINDEAIFISRKMYGNGKAVFIQNDAYATIFKDEAFDAIVAFEMIEHLKRPKAFLKEVRRLLKKNGVFIVSTPNRLVQSPDGKVMSPYHEKEYSPKEIEKLLRNNFKVTLYGQKKSEQAVRAVDDFMKSQRARQLLVDIDVLNLRKYFNKDFKERAWKKIGGLFGRQTQERVSLNDFNFSRNKIDSAEYIIAVCQK